MTDTLEQAKRTAVQWSLGQTSASYESGVAGAGAISTGKGDHGGVSYGSYQFSSATGTLQEYLQQSASVSNSLASHPSLQSSMRNGGSWPALILALGTTSTTSSVAHTTALKLPR